MMAWSGEIQPADMLQVRKGRDGKMVTIDDDVGGIVQQLKRIDPRLYVRWSESGEYFVVYTREDHDPEGTGHLVQTADALDGRLVKQIEYVYWKNRQPGYSYADELEAAEAKAEKEQDARIYEQVGENAEKLAHALRKDLGYDKHKAFIHREIPK